MLEKVGAEMTVAQVMAEIGKRARAAAPPLSIASAEQKNKAQ